MNPEEQYNIFKESGDLDEFFPKMTGDWEKDKARFTAAWAKNNLIIEEASNDEDFFLDEEEL